MSDWQGDARYGAGGPADGQKPPPPAVRDQEAERQVAGLCIAPLGAGPHECPTSLDLGTEAGRAQFLNAMNAPDLTLRGSDEVVIDVQDWVAYPRCEEDPDTGEVREYSVLVLIAPDGTRFATSSPVVAHRLAQAIRLHACRRFAPPLPCIVRPVRSRRTGQTYHELEVLPRAEAKPPA